MSPLLFALVDDIVTESKRDGLLTKILYADDLVLMSETLEGLKEKFSKWKGAFQSKEFMVNLGEIKMMVSRTEGERVESKVNPCDVCGKRTMANSMWCTRCVKSVHGRSTRWKSVTAKLANGFICGKCVRNDRDVAKPVERLCDEVDTVR